MALIADKLKNVNAHPERLKFAWKWVQDNGLDCQLITYLKDIGNATLYEMKLLREAVHYFDKMKGALKLWEPKSNPRSSAPRMLLYLIYYSALKNCPRPFLVIA